MFKNSKRIKELEAEVAALQEKNAALERRLAAAPPPQGGGKGASVPHLTKRPAMR